MKHVYDLKMDWMISEILVNKNIEMHTSNNTLSFIYTHVT